MLYKTLVDNSFSDFEDDWKERLKTINKALRSESYGEILQKYRASAEKSHKTFTSVSATNRK